MRRSEGCGAPGAALWRTGAALRTRGRLGGKRHTLGIYYKTKFKKWYTLGVKKKNWSEKNGYTGPPAEKQMGYKLGYSSLGYITLRFYNVYIYWLIGNRGTR